uniref:Immunoglobulin superfamily member 2 n=1 Tax=Fundulus heteroclitus TaxID=8078 RepID=A0A3Q2QWA7_FUNHE
MRVSGLFPWSPTLLTLLALFLRCGADVNTEIQPGPLYRVVGSRLSISCSTSGFPNENSDKDFKFYMASPARPTHFLNIISTEDPDFGYARFLRRIEAGDISLTRVGANSVIFEIKNLRKEDEGEYECSAVKPRSILNGVFSVKAVVKVIDNSLSVTSGESATSLTRDEGEALTLTCQASTNTIQHVHLSFIWYLRKDGAEEAKPIISLDKDFTLTPGQGFEQRYREEAIRLDKLGDADYRLQMTKLELSDQGQIYCQAQEWIQDPDRSWYKIAEKDAEEITLTVKPKETSALAVSLSAESAVQEGKELLLSCSISAQNLAGRFFSVAWLWEGNELVRMGPTGILTVTAAYSDQERDGELRATRTENSKYQLRLKPVRTTHGGSYVCRAWPEERDQEGNFKQGGAQDSQPQVVRVSTAESGLSVKMENTLQIISQGEKLRLTCTVDGFKGPLSVAWQHKSVRSPLFSTIIDLSEDGVTEKAEAFAGREVRVTRSKMETFVFEMDQVAPTDSGIYECVVSEKQANGKTHSKFQSANVTVKAIDSLVRVILKSRDHGVTVGENAHLMCKVTSPRVPMTLTWSVQKEDSNINTIVVLYSNGSISWSGDQHRYQVEVNSQENTLDVMHSLKILSASHREAGTYQCRVSVFLGKVHKKIPPSNQLKVMVNNPVSELALVSKPTITQSINTDIQIVCKVTSATPKPSLYEVIWELQQEAGNKTVLSSDRNALVTFGTQIEESDSRRISMRRTAEPAFELTIRQARLSDKGLYVCKVVEYLQDPQGEWYFLSDKTTTTNLNVTEPDTNLSIDKKELEVNVSIAEDFSIPCIITEQSSNESQFQVTWFWQKGAEAKPIYTAYRNSTLQPSTENIAVRYGHPLPGQFDLKVKTDAENSGVYFCEVEEWLYSHPYGWRKLAVEKSGNLTVNVDAEGRVNALSGPECMAPIWIAIFAMTVLTLLFVIMILVWRMCKKKTSGGNNSTLWVEQVPLNGKS